jgi:rhamnosyl/mannosyltransferase
MKVLQLGKFFPPVRGGIETATRNLAEGLAGHGLVADVLVAHTETRTQRERAAAGYEVVRVGSLGQWLSVSAAPGLPLELKRRVARYDLVHVHMPDPLAALALWWARPAARIVVHWHSDVVRQQTALRLYGPLQRWLLARADAVIATSPPYLAASSTLTPFRAKAVVVPLGIADPAAAVDAPGVAALRAAHGGRRLVAALGRMTYYKGFDVLLQAATRLAPDVRVLLGGSGPEQAAIELLVRRLGLEDRVHLLGDLADAEVATLMAACDVFCLPSTERAEAFGLAMLEAMALGRPVVCSRIEGSGVAWLNQHGLTGLTVPPGDASALAQALQQILDEPGLACRLGAEARVRYESGFRASQMVDATLALYRRLV